MASLKSEPAGRIRSMGEFFALAHAMEMEAAARYSETARQLRQQGVEGLADVFDRLAENERGHVRQVETWAERRDANAAAKTPWPLPDTFDCASGGGCPSSSSRPDQALASVVRHEERSFAFWTYVAAHADEGEVDAAERHGTRGAGTMSHCCARSGVRRSMPNGGTRAGAAGHAELAGGHRTASCGF